MKKIICAVTALLLILAMSACAAQPVQPAATEAPAAAEPSTEPQAAQTPAAEASAADASATEQPAADDTVINIKALKGPTGMGMAKLMDDAKPQYNITLASAPDEVTTAFIAGECDIAAVPFNMAGVLYNKTEGNVRMLAVNTLGVLYVLEAGDTIQSVADLEGKTIYATGQGATPEYILNYILEKNGLTDKVTVEFKGEHAELAALLASGEVGIGMLPEPNVTAAMMKNDKLRIALDLTDEWNKVADTAQVQGCYIVRADFYEAHKELVDEFVKDYAASVEFVNTNVDEAAEIIAKFEILPAAPIAKAAIPNCNIVCMTGEEMKAAAKSMFEILFAANPKSVGGAVPGDDIYVG